jgi:hypothetical protein
METQVYGPLMEMSSDGFHRAQWRPTSTATGTVRLEGYPREASWQTGAGVHVIAAPVSAGRYSMLYNIRAGEASPTVEGQGGWMWNKPEGALDRKPQSRNR